MMRLSEKLAGRGGAIDPNFRAPRPLPTHSRSRSGSSISGGMIFFALVAIVFVAALAGVPGRLANEQTTVEMLTSQGFSEIEITDRHVMFVQLRGCGHDDAVMYDVAAINPAGDPTTLQVCQGWPFKGATIRGQ